MQGPVEEDTMTVEDRIARLRTALAAAQAVKAEIEQRNDSDINPFRTAQRQPVLQRANNVILDCQNSIRDLEASQEEIELDPGELEDLDALGDRLAKAIAANALLDVAMKSLTTVLDAVSGVQDALKTA